MMVKSDLRVILKKMIVLKSTFDCHEDKNRYLFPCEVSVEVVIGQS
jgi:hypothetical protein